MTSTKKPTTTAQTPTTTLQPSSNEFVPIESSTCSEQFIAHATDCNKYYQCNNGHPLKQSCPEGLYWNDIQKNCDWPRNVNCQTSEAPADHNTPTTSHRPTTTTTRKPRPKPPTNIVSTETDDGKFKVVCYFTNWAWYRPNEGRHVVLCFFVH